MKLWHKKWFKYIVLILLGISSALSFAPYYYTPFLMAGFSTLFYFLNNAKKKYTGFLLGFCFFGAFGASSLNWLSQALLLDNGEYAYVIPAMWIFMWIVYGCFNGVACFLSMLTKKGYCRLFAFAGWMVIFEWIRTWIWTGFPWNLMGYALGDWLPLLQSASFWGIYGLTFVVVCTFSVFAFLPKIKPLLVAVGAIIFLYILGQIRLYSTTTDYVMGVKLRLVQPAISQSHKWKEDVMEENVKETMLLSMKDNKGITHIIWPEVAVPYFLNQNIRMQIFLIPAIPSGATLITGGMRLVENPDGTRQATNTVFQLDDMGRIINYYDKVHLVPFGEYMPFRKVLGLEKFAKNTLDFLEGDSHKALPIQNAPSVSPLVCYEIIFSSEIVDKKHRPGWLVVVSNDAWFNTSAGPYQHFQMARLRSIEEGLPLVRAANTGISAVVDSYGRIIAYKGLMEKGVLDSQLPVAIKPTLYADYGRTIPVLMSFLVILYTLLYYADFDKKKLFAKKKRGHKGN